MPSLVRLLALLPLLLLAALSSARAEKPDYAKTFPDLVLEAGDAADALEFKNSGTTRDLYAKYYGYARTIHVGKTAEHKKTILALIERDAPYWKTEAAREYREPPAPKEDKGGGKGDKKKKSEAAKEAKKRQEKEKALFELRKAKAEAYHKWLTVSIPAWLDTIP